MKTLLKYALAAFFSLSTGSELFARDYYVSTTGTDRNGGRYGGADNPYKTIQFAVDKANRGDTIIVRQGTYAPFSTVNSSGGGRRLTIRKSDRADFVIIDGGYTNRCATLVEDVTSPSVTNTVLRGLTLVNGKSIAGAGVLGGTLIDCTIADNTAASTTTGDGYVYGVGAYYSTLIDCTLTNNTAALSLDFIYGSAACNSVLTGCTVSGNTVSGGGGLGTLANCVATDCTITGNSIKTTDRARGGAAYESDLINCTVSDNSVEGGLDTEGGALYEGTATDCTFLRNSASSASRDLHGGGVFKSTLVNCILQGNHAEGLDTNNAGESAVESQGGGAYESTLINCLLIDNVASAYGQAQGGGAYNSNLFNCTVTRNQVRTSTSQPSAGGGVYWGTANNCIIWGNTDATSAVQPSSEDFDYNAVLNFCCTGWLPGTSQGANNIVANPLFFADVDQIEKPTAADFHVLPTSPCLDAGNDAAVEAETDLVGQPRILGAAVDMGAFEGSLIEVYVNSNRDTETDTYITPGEPGGAPINVVAGTTFSAPGIVDGRKLEGFAVNGIFVEGSNSSTNFIWRGAIKTGDTLTAVYRTYLSYNANGGRPSNIDSTRIAWGAPYPELRTAFRRGYEFGGWYTARVGGDLVAEGLVVTNASDHTVYARWRSPLPTPEAPEGGFFPVAGTYNGVAYELVDGGGRQAWVVSGVLKVTVTPSTGRVTAQLTYRGKRISFKAPGLELTKEGGATVEMSAKDWTLRLYMQQGQLWGDIITPEGIRFSADAALNRLADKSDLPAQARLAALIGKYTGIIPVLGDEDGFVLEENTPSGVSYFTATVAKNGNVRYAGRMADDTAFTFTAPLQIQTDDENELTSCAPLYAAVRSRYKETFVGGMIWFVQRRDGSFVLKADPTRRTSAYWDLKDWHNNFYWRCLRETGGFGTWATAFGRPYTALSSKDILPKLCFTADPGEITWYAKNDPTPYIVDWAAIADEGIILTNAKVPKATAPAWDGTAYSYAGDNISKLTCRLTRANGLLSGGFSGYVETPSSSAKPKLNKLNAKWSGVLLQNPDGTLEGYGFATTSSTVPSGKMPVSFPPQSMPISIVQVPEELP